MKYKKGDLIRLIDINGAFHNDCCPSYIRVGNIYRINDNLVTSAVSFETLDGKNRNALFLYRFEKVDPNSLTKLEKAIYCIK